MWDVIVEKPHHRDTENAENTRREFFLVGFFSENLLFFPVPLWLNNFFNGIIAIKSFQQFHLPVLNNSFNTAFAIFVANNLLPLGVPWPKSAAHSSIK